MGNRHRVSTGWIGLLLVFFLLVPATSGFQRAWLAVEGTVVAKDLLCQQPQNNRCATTYTLASGKANSKYVAGPVDYALSQDIPVGAVVKKTRWELGYTVNGKHVDDLSILPSFLFGFIAFAIVVLALYFFGYWKPNRGKETVHEA